MHVLTEAQSAARDGANLGMDSPAAGRKPAHHCVKFHT
jgi:hypothetical protein